MKEVGCILKKILPVIIIGSMAVVLEAKADEPMKALAAIIVTALGSFAVGLFTKFPKSSNDDLPPRSGLHSEQRYSMSTVDELILLNGEPDDVILLDPTRGNDARGVILVYMERRWFIINGEGISFDDIEDVTFNNTSVVYSQDSYQVVIKLKQESPSCLYLPVGYDREWATQVVKEIRQLIPII